MPAERRENIPQHRGELLQQRRDESRERIQHALAVSAETIPEDSSLRRPGASLDTGDVEQAMTYLEKLGPVTAKNWPLHLHIRRVGEFARRLTQKLKQLPPDKAGEFAGLDPRTVQVQGLFHDIGKVAGQFGYLRTEYEGDAILKRSGMQHLAVDTVRLGHRFLPLEKLTPLEKLIMYADMCGGVDTKDPARITTFNERLQYHKDSRTLKSYTKFNGLMPAFNSEIHGLVALDEGDKDRYTALYTELDRYFRDLGIDRKKIRQKMMRDERQHPLQPEDALSAFVNKTDKEGSYARSLYSPVSVFTITLSPS